MSKIITLVSNRLIRLTGNIFKILSYSFHFALPRLRFTIPDYSPAWRKCPAGRLIPRTIWQTNFTSRVTLPVYLNYLLNRLLSYNCDYHYMSTEARDIFLKNCTPDTVYEAYSKLTDGAAQADLWRLVVLQIHGGVYIDIDATLVCSLDRILDNNQELYIKNKNNSEITNYFIASVANNPNLQAAIEQVVYNINHYDPSMGVFNCTGPAALTSVLKIKPVNIRDRTYVCIQGTFTNEYFQYMDKPRGKWIYTDSKKLVKNKPKE